ncbi:choline/carnitine O-acyltransferase, partial [Salmonella enterica]
VQDYLNSKACAQIETIIAERAQNTHSSWLANWWVQYAYLTSTGPVSPEVNAPYYLELPTVG